MSKSVTSTSPSKLPNRIGQTFLTRSSRDDRTLTGKTHERKWTKVSEELQESSTTASVTASLGSFLTGLGAVIEGVRETQARMDRVAATRFSVFWYFKRNENIISGIFADLLRADGSHGQGSTFLRLLKAWRMIESQIRKRRRRPRVRGHALVGNVRTRVEREYGLPEGSVKLVYPGNTRAVRADVKISKVRQRWGQ